MSIGIKIEIIFWRILKRSLVFRYWYRRFLWDLLLDLEIYDLDREYIVKKYRDKFARIKGEK